MISPSEPTPPAKTGTFDAETHTYFVGDRVVPSVTQVLELAGLVDKRWFTDFGRERGTLVHQALALDDAGDLDEDSLDPLLVPYVQAWRQVCRELGARWAHIEHPMIDATHGVGGTLDRFGVVQDRPCVADIKTGSVEPYIGIQLAGYAWLAELTGLVASARRVHRLGVFLTADGQARLVQYADQNDIHVFRAALTVAQWRLAHDPRLTAGGTRHVHGIG